MGSPRGLIYLSGPNLHNIGSTLQMFAEEPPLLIEFLGKDNYWSFDEQGHRKPYSVGDRGTIIPKGKALSLELAAKGMAHGFTKLGYLDEVVAIRNEMVPGLKLNFVEVKFDWEVTPDPIGVMEEEFTRRKRERISEKAQSAPLDRKSVDAIRSYWKGRPTSISYFILGGNLNPTLKNFRGRS